VFFSQNTFSNKYMKKHIHQFTSESVSAGHPDKIADQISDAILDAYLAQDPQSKVAIECLITTQKLLIAGEVTSSAKVNAVNIAEKVLDQIGYNDLKVGFDWKTAAIEQVIHQQSPQIYQSVLHGGAGDQGIMFGHACSETPEFMPLAISLSHQIVRKLHELRTSAALPWLRPDAKSQVTISYEGDKPICVDTVVVSAQHDESVTQAEIRRAIIELILEPLLEPWLQVKQPEYLINPSGIFVLGGPHSDTGLTGRKIVVDTYGGSCPHGGGAFSGKDPSKVDRSAAYAARYIAKHLVASGLLSKCTVQLSYAIGVSEPTSVHIDSFGTHQVDLRLIEQCVRDVFPVTPNSIIEELGLKRPIYFPTASYGHFGNENFPWEQLDSKRIQKLKQLNSGRAAE
jgi:S-adenosylmethionine synthetase